MSLAANATLEASLVTFLVDYRDVADAREMVAALRAVVADIESGRLVDAEGRLRADAEDRHAAPGARDVHGEAGRHGPCDRGVGPCAHAGGGGAPARAGGEDVRVEGRRVEGGRAPVG